MLWKKSRTNEATQYPTPAPAVRNRAPSLVDQVMESLRTVYDPEIPVNILELGIVYKVEEIAPGDIYVEMTLTAPNCPAAQSMPEEIEMKLKGIPGVGSLKLEIVWDPPWNPNRMSEAARLELGMF
ncbi:MAG: FeS assembly SUF system protein [Armatimonadetes bacterium CG07_land_8_20_14_0_80_59_28]|nr:MAG: FeS assembly SUF system protein [Armatimonadetes bacterium CG07_land_8_20_14_0_80_59_28]PIX42720.1 MAG: FeS assembly SUF system protein [Armatimonadetes bacterium CG_4_8_14_3_um_filter_58_9]